MSAAPTKNGSPELTKADFQSSTETRWCPGCGDYAVLAAVQGFLPELGVPPAVGGIVAFIAPIVPLGLGLAAFTRARSAWLSPYERSEAIKFVVIASLMLFAVLELGPLGAVYAAASTAAKTAPTHPM